ncbi:MAG: hypothetical protein NTV21_02155 [Planctomycetota bacterium]|nr:hypothetical protein [Planctomycetota bacterium]
MKRIALLLNLLALLALVALAGPRLEQVAFEAELLERTVAEERGPSLVDETPPCLAPAEPAGPGGARKEGNERELGGADGDVERFVPGLPETPALLEGERHARVRGVQQPHLRVNGAADAFGARC